MANIEHHELVDHLASATRWARQAEESAAEWEAAARGHAGEVERLAAQLGEAEHRAELKPIYLDEPERIALLEAIQVAIRYEVAVRPYGTVDSIDVSILLELRERIRSGLGA